MDVSNPDWESDGQDLLKTLICLTGLPEEWARTELNQILEQYGPATEKLTLEQLREVMVAYLEALQMDLNEAESEAKRLKPVPSA